MLERTVLNIDPAETASTIAAAIREQVLSMLHRRGVVVGLSGGVDSAVVASLAVRAIGAERVLALLMPERDSSVESFTLGRRVAEQIGIRVITENIAPILSAAGCYDRQEEAIRTVFHRYGDGWKCKIGWPPLGGHERLNAYSLTVQSPEGQLQQARMPAAPFLQLVAATSFKQRARKMLEYYHADRLQYAVAGTANRLEHELGLLVKQGDDAADLKPIAHLYKTQVVELAALLKVPLEVRERSTTTAAEALPLAQEESYFALPYPDMDLCLWALHHGIAADEVAPTVKLTPEQVERVFADIRTRRRAAEYLHSPPLTTAALTD